MKTKSGFNSGKPDIESRDIHCPRLGGQVRFDYCLHPAQDTPCFRILDCWWQTFDVQAYLRDRLPQNTFEALLEKPRPPDRLHSILTILEQLAGKGRDP